MKTQRPRRRRRNATEWKELVAAWQASGQRAVDFAVGHDISEHSLWKWRKRLEDGSGDEVDARKPRFVSVSLSAEPGAAVSSVRERVQGPIELELPGGQTLRLKGAVEVSTLVSLARELSSC
ncbi:MAG: hypothetical protein AAF219_11065 [Myxococcota bacterium]